MREFLVQLAIIAVSFGLGYYVAIGRSRVLTRVKLRDVVTAHSKIPFKRTDNGDYERQVEFDTELSHDEVLAKIRSLRDELESQNKKP